MRLPEAVVQERDHRAYEMRKAGMSFRQIARALQVSESTAHAAVTRMYRKIGTKFAEDNVDTVRLELDRLDALMQNIWPMTMPHRVESDDGDTITLPPNFDAIDRVLKIMDRRAKLLGLDSATLNVNAGGQNNGAPGLGAKEQQVAEITPEQEARRLMALMQEAGVIDQAMMVQIRRALGEDVVDVESVEANTSRAVPVFELPVGDEEEIAPEWMPDDGHRPGDED